MEMINSTGMVIGYTLGVEPSGRELLVVAIKGTYAIPVAGGEACLHREQLPLVVADTFTGEPGFSAPLDEVDFSPRKHRCDVLLRGSAYAPHGEAATRVPVGIRIGDWKKVFAVVGDRHWRSGLIGVRASAPAPFVKRQISYDVAFGGLDNFDEDPAKHAAFMPNPVGRGWHKHLQSKFVDGTPLPNTESFDQPVAAPDGAYAPMSFGPVGRGWSSRLPHAGTYDQDWLDSTFPFLPADFKDEYYQAAPLDQQIAYLRGGEEVALINLTAEGRASFRLPTLDIPVTFFERQGGHREIRPALDTVAFRPDDGVFTLTWRATLPLKKNIFEVPHALVGKMSAGWWRARALGKTWYPSLKQVVDLRQAEGSQ